MLFLSQITDQLKSRFSSGLSLPQICENFIKAAYDPRISGIYLHIDRLNCGWGKVEEIRRHILDFKKSGFTFISEASVDKSLNHFSIDDQKCVFLQVNSLWAMHLHVEKKNITLVVHAKNFTFPRVLTLPCMG